jgi:GTP1/Obg family GTP-binding protein
MRKILDSMGLINKILSGAQRKTPTIVHKRFSVERIRKFYIRKVKFVQQNFIDYVSEIVDTFPSIDYIHPFFRDLLNLIFQREHYKFSLSRLSKSKRIVNIVCKNFIKLIKNGNSLYTCKQLKKEALGRICTTIRKINKSLIFLEKIRKHIEKIPELDPYRKIVILCGTQKVGKTSCLNKLTRANIDIGNSSNQNNFMLLGHMQTNLFRLQMLELSILSNSNIYTWSFFIREIYLILFNLDCVMLHMIDFSEYLSISVSNQIDLFIKLSAIKPKIKKLLVFTKTDLGWEKFFDKSQKAALQFLLKKNNITTQTLKVSFHDEIGIYFLRLKITETTFSSFSKTPDLFEKRKPAFYNQLNNVSTNCIEPFHEKSQKHLISRILSPKIKLDTNSEKLSKNGTCFFDIIDRIYNKDLIPNSKKNNYSDIYKHEKEQKKREIKTEKTYVDNKISYDIQLENSNDLIYIKNNKINFTNAICQ